MQRKSIHNKIAKLTNNIDTWDEIFFLKYSKASSPRGAFAYLKGKSLDGLNLSIIFTWVWATFPNHKIVLKQFLCPHQSPIFKWFHIIVWPNTQPSCFRVVNITMSKIFSRKHVTCSRKHQLCQAFSWNTMCAITLHSKALQATFSSSKMMYTNASKQQQQPKKVLSISLRISAVLLAYFSIFFPFLSIQ